MDEKEYTICEECDKEFIVEQIEGDCDDIEYCPFCGSDIFSD